MKKLMLTGIFLLLGIFAISAEDLPSITIVNNTGYAMYLIFISPSDDDYWGDELLGDEILENGQSFNYELPYPLSQVNTYDMFLIDEDEDFYLKWRVRVSNNARIVFTFDDIDYEYGY